MTTLLIIITVAAMLFLMFALMQMSGGKSQGVNIQTDENSKIHVSTSGTTLQIHITYESTENRPSDAFLFPDDDPLPPPSGALDRTFWRKVASYDELSKEERMEIDEILERHGFYHRDDDGAADAMRDEDDEAAFVEAASEYIDGGYSYDPDEVQPDAGGEFSPEFTY